MQTVVTDSVTIAKQVYYFILYLSSCDLLFAHNMCWSSALTNTNANLLYYCNTTLARNIAEVV
jgi:hypothetical protein